MPEADTPVKDLTDEEFETKQKEAAQAQNLGDGAVPEQRPQAFLERPDNDSPLTKRLREEGVIDQPAHGKEEYERAASDAQAKKAAKTSVKPTGFFPGSFWQITEGPYRGEVVAFTRVQSYKSDADRLQVAIGSQAQNYIEPEEIEGRLRGGDRDGELVLLNVVDAGLVKLENWRGTVRGG